MSTEEIIERFIADEILLSKEKLDHKTSLVLSGIIDSLGLLRLIAFVEERFQITVADDDVSPENFDSIDLTATYINSRQ